MLPPLVLAGVLSIAVVDGLSVATVHVIERPVGPGAASTALSAPRAAPVPTSTTGSASEPATAVLRPTSPPLMPMVMAPIGPPVEGFLGHPRGVALVVMLPLGSLVREQTLVLILPQVLGLDSQQDLLVDRRLKDVCLVGRDGLPILDLAGVDRPRTLAQRQHHQRAGVVRVELGRVGHGPETRGPDAVIKARGPRHLPLHLAPHAADLFQDASRTGPRTDQNVVSVVLEIMFGDPGRDLRQLYEPLRVRSLNRVAREEDCLLDGEPVVPRVLMVGRLRDSLVMLIYHLLYLGGLDHGVQLDSLLDDVQHVPGDRGPDRTTAHAGQSEVILGDEVPELLHVLVPVLVDAYVLREPIRPHYGLQKRLLEVHRTGEPLTLWARGGLQAHHVKLEALALADAPN